MGAVFVALIQAWYHEMSVAAIVRVGFRVRVVCFPRFLKHVRRRVWFTWRTRVVVWGGRWVRGGGLVVEFGVEYSSADPHFDLVFCLRRVVVVAWCAGFASLVVFVWTRGSWCGAVCYGVVSCGGGYVGSLPGSI